MRTALLHRLAFGIWAIEPNRAQAYYGLVSALLSGSAPPATERKPLMAGVVRADDQDGAMVFEVGPEAPRQAGDVLVIGITDVILKGGDECTYGMADVSDMLEGADRDDTVQGVVLSIDSPGGEGNGMMLLADTLGRMKKPVVAHINHGMAASAAYGIAASCNEVYASSPQDMFGSTGTYVTLIDMAGYMRAKGAPVHEVYATLSTDKNGAVREAFKADGKDPDSEHYARLRAEYIDPFNTAFLGMLKKKRPQMEATADKWQGGGLFYADDAITYGMVDGYATQAEAVQRVRALATAAPAAGQPTTNNRQPSTTMKFTTLFNNALVALGLTEEKPVPTTEDITKANAALTETGYQLATTEQVEALAGIDALRTKANTADELRQLLTGETAKVQATMDSLKASLAKHNVALAEGEDPLTKTMATLDTWAAKPGATHTGAPKAGDDKPAKPELTASQKVAQEAGISMG